MTSATGTLFTDVNNDGTFAPLANVWSLWSDLDNGAFIFPRTMMNTPLAGPNGSNGQLTSGVGVNASIGYGNYQGGFVSFKMADWHGLTTQSNFRWTKTLSTGAGDTATGEATATEHITLRTGDGPP